MLSSPIFIESFVESPSISSLSLRRERDIRRTAAKKVVYLLLLFAPQEVVNARRKNNNYDIGHFIAIRDINEFMGNWRSKNAEFVCDCCGNTFRTEELRDKHINEGCYTKTTKQFELTKKDVFFYAHSKCPRNEFVQYIDSEAEMDKNIDPDDDWDEEHIPQAIEAHMVSKYQHIFDLFHIPTHVQFRGKDNMKQYADSLMKFYEKIDIGREKPVSFSEYVRYTNKIDMTPEQRKVLNNSKEYHNCGDRLDKDYGTEQEEKIEQNERDEEKLTVGKYKGKSFRDVRDHHPDYCEWVEEKKGIKRVEHFMTPRRHFFCKALPLFFTPTFLDFAPSFSISQNATKHFP